MALEEGMIEDVENVNRAGILWEVSWMEAIAGHNEAIEVIALEG